MIAQVNSQSIDNDAHEDSIRASASGVASSRMSSVALRKKTTQGGLNMDLPPLQAEEEQNQRLQAREASVLQTSARRQRLQNLLAKEQDTLQQDLEQLDNFINAISNNIIRLREIKDIFIVSIREKKRMIKVRQNTLVSRKRIYEVVMPKRKVQKTPTQSRGGSMSGNFKDNAYSGGPHRLK